MSGKVMNKMMGFLGLDEEIEDEVETSEGAEEFVEDSEVEPLISKRGSKVVSIKTATSAKVLIVKPSTYEEAAEICDELKNRKIVVVNTTKLENRIAQRLLDFVSGASYALGGSLEEVESGIYVVTPSNIEVSNELKNELNSKGIFNWTK
ncbi:MAG: sepF [Clostridiaceae bacterium]|nr:sepF [Clostridiaceae bacterium]